MHEAHDGGLARVRVPGGALSPASVEVLARAADELGDGQLELTSRGNVQLRGLGAGAETDLAVRLRAAGLLPSWTHERVRNIVASARSGRDHQGQLDIRPLVTELDRALCADPVLARLSGRFLFCVDDGRGDVTGLGADVGLLGLAPDRVAVLLAGVDEGIRTTPAAAAWVAVAAARAFLDERAAQGSSAWRLSELDGATGRVAARLGLETTEPSARSHPAAVPRREVGPLPQRDARVTVAVGVPLGRLTTRQARALVGVANGEIRVTPWRTVHVPDLAPAPATEALVALAIEGLATDPASPWLGVTACAGSTGCAKALADVRADAATVHLRGSGTVLPVHWVGCERACGRPAGRHVEVRATGAGYRVTGSEQALADLAEVRAAVAAA